MIKNTNAISSFYALSGLKALTALFVGGNQVGDVSVLAGLSGLQTLDISENQLDDVSPLANCTQLTRLSVRKNCVTDIAVLENLKKLEEVNLRGNQISDLSPLVYDLGLGSGCRIDVRDNPLSQEAMDVQIPELEKRGVVVLYDGHDSRASAVEPDETGMVEMVGIMQNAQPGGRFEVVLANGEKGTIGFNLWHDQKFGHILVTHISELCD